MAAASQTIPPGGVEALPLAPLCRLPRGVAPADALPAIIRRIDERLRAEAPPEDARKLLMASYVLTGLRIPGDLAAEMFKGLPSMRDSSTYQLILNEGRVEGQIQALRKTIHRLGRIRFGPPDETIQTVVNSITDGDRLERMTERLLLVSSWQDLLATP